MGPERFACPVMGISLRIWTAARITASSTHGLAPPQASPSQSRSHLASGLALKTITSMIRHDWVKCNDDVRQISGLCSSWLRGKDPSMTLGAFQHLWCHNHALASVHTVETGPEGRLELRTWHRLRLAVLHSIWTAARITASSTHGLAPPQASPSQSRSHLASGLALKTITSMIRHDWVKCNDDVRQISGLCSSWLRGKDPSMTLGAFQHLWCHNRALASVHNVQTGPEGRLELRVSVPLGSSATGSATDSTASRPLTPHDQPLPLATGITKVAHLQAALQQQHPAAFTACLQSVLMTMPPPWRAIATAAPTAPAWRQGLSASGSQLIQNTHGPRTLCMPRHGDFFAVD
ncbi:TPA: hypothetical protein ACH3X1_009910 [Trebouxia sp. C0004]